MNSEEIAAYIKCRKDKVEGWFARCDAEIFATLLNFQVTNDINGGVSEIGVHHGKSFIPMALSNDGENCYVIDVFGKQDLNIDNSGKGDRESFFKNLIANKLSPEKIVVDERISTEVRPEDIVSQVGAIRFFHIDGGHHYEAITNDIRLAEDVISDDGIIAIDDVFRPEWPDVSIGTFAQIGKTSKGLVAFAIGFNKTYFCHGDVAKKYRSALLENRILKMFLVKRYKITNNEILVFQTYPLPEWGVKLRVVNYLKTYHPDLAFSIWKRISHHHR